MIKPKKFTFLPSITNKQIVCQPVLFLHVILPQLLVFEFHEQYVNPINYEMVAISWNLSEVPRNVFLFMYRTAFRSVLHMYASSLQLLTKYLSVSLNRRKRFGNTGSDWRLILKWTLERERIPRIWTGFIWLRIGSIRLLLRKSQWNRRISSLYENILATQKRFLLRRNRVLEHGTTIHFVYAVLSYLGQNY
jgi:hypothetical protein